MIRFLIKYKSVQYAIILGMLIVTAITIFPPDIYFIKQTATHAVPLMLTFLFMGLFLLTFKLKKLFFTSFACCASLCFFLKSASNGSLRFNDIKTQKVLNVGHVNLASLENDFQEVLDSLIQMPIDVWCFQEYTPDFAPILSSYKKIFPYKAEMLRIDPFGVVFLSKIPILSSDTILIENIPSLNINVRYENSDVHIYSVYSMPPTNEESYSTTDACLQQMAKVMVENGNSNIVLGDFNLVSWSREIKNFRSSAKLFNSRRDILPIFHKGSLTNINGAIDHIFFGENFNCVGFNELRFGKNNSHIGIVGRYQMSTNLN
jgi:hypothetical protein